MPPAERKPSINRPRFQLESSLWQHGFARVAGVDEVGRGPLAGPVVAAAVVFPPNRPFPTILLELNDSKKLTAAQRKHLLSAIHNAAIDVSLGQASPLEIDRLNIRQATLLAMSRALAALSNPVAFVLVDGRDIPDAISCPARAVIKGDTISASIAAASIVAKIFRDRLMAELDTIHPGYGWAHNSGYPTREHRQALQYLGVTEQHRRSFAPVRNLLTTKPNP